MFEKLIVGFDGTDTGIDGLILSMGLAKAFGSPVEFRARTASSPARGLHGPVVSDDADLIVLGSRRPGPWTKVAFGGVSENVMRAAPCAVAVAPRGCRNDAASSRSGSESVGSPPTRATTPWRSRAGSRSR